MDALFRLVLTNAALSGLLALAAWAASRFVRRQAVVHALWLLALVKLVTPPLVSLPLLPSPGAAPEVRADRGAERKGASAATAAKAIARPPAPAGPRLAPPVRGDSPARETPLLPAPSGALPVAVASRADGLGLAAAARLVLPLLLVLGALAVAGLSALRFARFRRLLSDAEPAPDESMSGTTPRMNANDVMRIGRNLSLAASRVASSTDFPLTSCSIFANSTIRMAFFAARPMSRIRPI